MAKRKAHPTEPLHEDPESQPHGKHKKGTQGELPGVLDKVKKYPDLDHAMVDLLYKLDEVNKAKLDFEDQRTTVMELIHRHKIPSYAIDGLMVGTTEKEERLYVKRLKERTKKPIDGETEAA